MSQVAANADDYAANRLNRFFTANGETPNDGDLTGQCVTLVKWFMAEMSDVPSPFAARGDARYVGKRLVAQGLAVEVAYSERRRGDVICYEYGTYGHIGIVLSGDRTFEENVNWAGVASKIVDGARVYASRIGNLSESWRHDQHIYRLNSYKEGDMGQVEDLQNTIAALHKELETERATYEQWIKDRDATIKGLRDELDGERKGYEAMISDRDAKIADLIKNGGSDPDLVQLAALLKKIVAKP